jgi:lipopolysaccharide exporter
VQQEDVPRVATSGVVSDEGRSVAITKQSSFAGDILRLAGGTTFAQALGVLLAPILTRLYAPDAFGIAALFTSITSIVGLVAGLRYELAIMLPARDEDAANLLAVSLCSVLVITGLSAMLVLLAGESIVRLLNAPTLAPYLWLVPVSVFATGSFAALNYWNSRTRHFGRVALARASQSIVTGGGQLCMGLAGHAHAGALIGAGAVGSTVVTGVLGACTWCHHRCTFLDNIRWPQMLKWAKRHRKFPMVTAWAGLLNSVSWQLPAFLLSFFYSPAVVGYYAVGARLLQLPMSLIGTAISQVFFQRASAAQSVDGSVAEVVAPLFRRLVALGAFPMILLTLTGPDLFVAAFGEQWSEAGVYTQLLSPWVFFAFVSSPLTPLFSILERQEGALLLGATLLTTRFLSLVAGGMLGDPRWALTLFATTGALVYGGLSAWLLKASGVPRGQALHALLKYLVLSIILASPAAAIGALVPTGSLIVLVAAAAASGVYGIILLRDEPGLTRRLIELTLSARRAPR